MEAAQNGHTELVKLLLANGADVNVKDNKGRTALDWAMDSDHMAIVDLLQNDT